MKCVILAAGKSLRMRPLTETMPKPLLKVANVAILEYNLLHLKKFVDEIIIVIGYKGDMIKDYFGDYFEGIKLTYVEQKEQKGTGHALLQVKDLLHEKFIMLNGDCIYSEKDIDACVVYNYAILGSEVNDPEHYGVMEYKDSESGQVLINIIEKSSTPISNLINAGLYVLDESIFDILSTLKVS